MRDLGGFGEGYMGTLHFCVRKNKYIIGLGQLFTHFFNLTVFFVRSEALESTFLHVCCLYKYGSFFTFNQEPTGSLRNLLGPFHLDEGETHTALPFYFFQKTNIWGWGDGINHKWVDEYSFVQNGLFF